MHTVHTAPETRLFHLLASIGSVLESHWLLAYQIILVAAKLGKPPEELTLEELADVIRRERAAFERQYWDVTCDGLQTFAVRPGNKATSGPGRLTRSSETWSNSKGHLG